MNTEPMITIPMRHYEDLVEIAIGYESESARLRLSAGQIAEVREYLNESTQYTGSARRWD